MMPTLQGSDKQSVVHGQASGGRRCQSGKPIIQLATKRVRVEPVQGHRPKKSMYKNYKLRFKQMGNSILGQPGHSESLVLLFALLSSCVLQCVSLEYLGEAPFHIQGKKHFWR